MNGKTKPFIAVSETRSLCAADRLQADRIVELCAAADGFVQEMHDDNSLNIDKTLPPWILAHGDDGLVGLACLFGSSRDEVEMTAWTAPAYRRRGVFSALLQSVRQLAAERAISSILFCVDGGSTTGALVAARCGAAIDFSEYEMFHDVENGKIRQKSGLEKVSAPAPMPVSVPGFEVRKTLPSDVDEMARASVDIFGDSEDMARNFIMVSMAAPARTQYTALLDGRIIGMCAASGSEFSGNASDTVTDAVRDAASGKVAPLKSVMINGLGIIASHRGRGLGRALLCRVMEIAAEGGADRIVLEVDSVNEAAYPLYKSAGFSVTRRTDYYRLNMKD